MQVRKGQRFVSTRAVVAAVAAAAGLAVAAEGAPVAIVSHIEDHEAQKRSDDGTYAAANGGGEFLRVGQQTNFTQTSAGALGGINAIYMFALPALQPGEEITGASFSVGVIRDTASSATAPNFNADLYVLGVDRNVTPTKTAASAEDYWFVGADQANKSFSSADVVPDIRKVQDNFFAGSAASPSTFFVPSTSSEYYGPVQETDAAGDAALLDAILDAYTAPGFTPGDYLLVRLNPDGFANNTGTRRYATALAAHDQVASKPTLTLTIVPEPTALALLAIGGAGLLLRRRRA